MPTNISSFNYKDCEKIDGRMVNAYVDAHLNNENPVELDVETTWGDSAVDLTDAVKAAETITRMELGSNAIEYFAEDGHVDCIYGDDLSRIISMHLLKDVDINTPPVDGDVYIYDGDTNKFKTFNLQQYMTDVNNTITNLGGLINQLRNRITNLENTIQRPSGIPTDTGLVWGNINLYSDYTNGNLKTSGLYTHSINTDKNNDEYFA